MGSKVERTETKSLPKSIQRNSKKQELKSYVEEEGPNKGFSRRG